MNPAHIWHFSRRWTWRGLKYALITLLAVLVLVLVLFATTLALLRSEGGRQWIIERVNDTGLVQIGALEGDLWNSVTILGFSYTQENIAVAVDRAHWQWRLRDLVDRHFTVSTIELGHVVITQNEADTTPSTPTVLPESLTLPLTIDVANAKIDLLQIGAVKLSNIEFELYSTGKEHWINLINLGAEQGAIKGSLAMSGVPPFDLGGSASFDGTIDDLKVGFDFDLEGSLRNVHLLGYVASEKWLVTSDARVDLFADAVNKMVHEATLRLDHINPAVLLPSLPQADLSMMLELQPLKDADNQNEWLQGYLEVENAKAGLLNEGMLPVRRIDSDLSLGLGQVFIRNLVVKGVADTQITGKGWVRTADLYLSLAMHDLDPRKLYADLPGLKLNGNLDVTGTYEEPQLALTLRENLNKLRLEMQGKLTDSWSSFTVSKLNLKPFSGQSLLSATAHYDLAAQKLSANAQLQHVNLADWDSVASDLNGSFVVDLAIARDTEAAVRLDLAPGTLAGIPLNGQILLRYTPLHLEDIQVLLNSGATQLKARGRLPLKKAVASLDNTIHFDITAADLGQWLAGAAGRVSGKGIVYGDLDDLHLETDIEAQQLSFAELSAASAHLQLDSQLNAELPFKAGLTIDNIRQDTLSIPTATLAASGNLQRQELTLTAPGKFGKEAFTAHLALRGEQQDERWAGVLETLALDSRLSVKLAAPVAFSIGAEQMSLAAATLQVLDSTVQLQETLWTPQRLVSTGSLANINVLQALQTLGLVKQQSFNGDLILAGNWSYKQEKNRRQANFTLARQSGDLAFHTTSGITTTLALTEAKLSAQLKDDDLRSDMVLSSNRFGQANLAATARLPATLPTLSELPFELSAHAAVPDLGKAVKALTKEIRMTGALELNIKHSGPLKGGHNSGSLTGSNLSLNDALSGVAMNDGRMDIVLENDRLRIVEMSLGGGRGWLQVLGGVEWASGKPVAKLSFNAERMRLLQRSDMLLVVTGKGDLSYDETGITLLGNLKTNYGNITYRDESVPSLSDDVVIVGTDEDEDDVDQTSNLRFSRLEFDVDLGNYFRIRGYGVDTRVSGVLKLRARPNQALSAFGTLEATDGTYHAYGQKLEIKRGRVSFVGPIDNPTLDILAVRPDSSVDAGVTVRGTASRPQVALYSNPSMSTNETLSWLLFDHGIDSMDKSDSTMLFGVLNSMLAGSDGRTVTDSLLGGVVDEVGVSSARTSDGETTPVITVNKRLTRNISIGLEKSLNGLQDAVRLSWRFARSWSLISRFGVDDSAVDLRYTIRFN